MRFPRIAGNNSHNGMALFEASLVIAQNGRSFGDCLNEEPILKTLKNVR